MKRLILMILILVAMLSWFVFRAMHTDMGSEIRIEHVDSAESPNLAVNNQ